MRLPFKLAEFAPRVLWVSREARDVWEPRIKAVSAAWILAERQSVVLGARQSALQHVSPDELPSLMVWAAQNGLTVLPLERVKRVNGYQSATSPLAPGDPFDYKVAITIPERVADWSESWAKSDDDTIGRLLGTPECCRRFFDRIWKQESWFDTSWPMHAFRPIDGGWGTPTPHMVGLNMFWRWLGVRSVPHLPCSANCKHSGELAEKMYVAMGATERMWKQEILSWPVRYTSYAGQAEITTPILRMNVPTDALADRIEIRYQGSGYPAEGASGVGFPFKNNTQPKKLNFVRKKQNPSDNGFTSIEAQTNAHDALIHAMPGGDLGTVIDLGCGDGTLLNRTCALVQIGIERDESVADKARRNGVFVHTGDCTDKALIYRVIGSNKPDLIIAQRFRNPPESLSDYGCRVLSYDYEGGEPKLYDFR